MNKKVYLAGPMGGLTQEDMTGWRNQLTNILSNNNVDVLDPTRRVPFGGKGHDSIAYAKYIFDSDLRDIQVADAVFFNVRNGAGRGSGTQMEIMYSWMLKKKMYLWKDITDSEHPFYMSMDVSIHSNMSNLASFIVADLEEMQS